MTFSFQEVQPDYALEELYKTLRSLVVTEIAQYEIESDYPLADYPFHEEEKYRVFFDAFSEYASPLWNTRVDGEWDFSKFPFRKSARIMDGIYKLLRTGGASSETHNSDEALTVEEILRIRFQKGAATLLIFAVGQYRLSENENDTGFIAPGSGNLGEISSFFEQLAWDDLIFIINPKYRTLYVIACTDED
jgi:hypothetical protein